MRDTETVEPLAPVPPTAELRAGTVIDERYRIVRAIGRGGAAVVYEAVDTADDHRIALKLLHRVSEASIKRMQREVAVAQQCDDPLLVRYHDIRTSAAGTYVTMELVDATTLREYRSRCVPSIREVVAIAKQLTRAIALLHARGVLHRDIKPSNVLICPDGTIKLADFGLALDTADPERLTRSDAIVGTIDYLAPEQVLGRNVDERADLYSLGVLLFELLTGELPYAPTSSLGTLLARIRHPAPDVRTRRRDVPPWLARLIARLLRPSPAERYRSSGEVLAAFVQSKWVPVRDKDKYSVTREETYCQADGDAPVQYAIHYECVRCGKVYQTSYETAPRRTEPQDRTVKQGYCSRSCQTLASVEHGIDRGSNAVGDVLGRVGAGIANGILGHVK